MSGPKFELLPKDETWLHRIRALRDVGLDVRAGDLDGYIEQESNLSQEGTAQVSGDAWVYGNGLIVWFSKVGTENGTLTVYNAKNNTLEVTRGCFRGSVDEFLAASAKKHDARIKREYELLIEVAKSRIEAAREAVK